MTPIDEIDVKEDSLRRQGNLLDILLIDRTSKKNIIWGTDSYINYGNAFDPKARIKKELVTGVYSNLIQPRAVKSLDEQRKRTKDKAEVFTPLKIVDRMNKLIDWTTDNRMMNENNWQEYVSRLMLEVSCGEAPFIVSRYNPTSHTGKLITLSNRVGFLDRKLRVISKNCHKPKAWLKWAQEAYKSSYGYEWQGDNLLIARENLLYTLVDYYKDKFGRRPPLESLQEFAVIISWNIFQMDGIKYVIPMSCRNNIKTIPGSLTLFDEKPDKVEVFKCEGCSLNKYDAHNGKYVKIMDWVEEKPILFTDIISSLL